MSAADIGCGMGYFSIGMARIVGDAGKVISVDVQQEMLDILKKRAKDAGVAHRITAHLCDENDIGINEKVDFVLAFWMVHETPEEAAFLRQVQAMLNDSGRFLIAEPKMHVTSSEFRETLSRAVELGFKIVDSPTITFSHSAVLAKQ